MKHNYIILIALISFAFSQAQIVNIPDANFKNALVNTNCVDSNNDNIVDTDVDTNNDGEIQNSEAAAIDNLSVRQQNIVSLQGIEAFVNLQHLVCLNNQIVNLDLSSLSNLISLDCRNNNTITNLNITGLENLDDLNFYGNQIDTIDLSGLTNLTILECGGNNLSSIDLSGLPNLELLYCYENQLTDLNVSGMTNLVQLRMSNNLTTTLELINLPSLNSLICDNNELTSLDIGDLPNLTSFNCNNNQLTSLFLKDGRELSFITFSGNPNLEYVCVDENETSIINFFVDDYGYSNAVVNSYCTFNPGGDYYEFEGNVIFDLDNNGCDINDNFISSVKFYNTDVNNNLVGVYTSNLDGHFSIPVRYGLQTVTPVFENPAYFLASPVSVSADFPTDISPVLQDFCFTSEGNYNDLEIVVIPLQVARPGFDSDYKIVYKNKGNTILSGTLELNYNENDGLMDFVSASPNIDSDIANVLTWPYADLLPFEAREIRVTFSLNTPIETPPLNAGDALGFIANIFPLTTDETPEDNSFSLKQIVVNSLDPNDKTCLQGTTIELDQVGKFVHYIIRFENTGTADAINIVVKDEIDLTKYDVNTLIPLNASHDFVTRIKDDNIVEFIFEDINLPFDDANNDGYVLFKIKTLESLGLGDTFSNDAEIYFDYNFPIITNDETTTVAVLSIEESELQTTKIYPNPVSNELTIESQNNLKSISIFDVNGRQLQSIVITRNTTNKDINLSHLAEGLYFVTIKTDTGIQTTKIIKE